MNFRHCLLSVSVLLWSACATESVGGDEQDKGQQREVTPAKPIYISASSEWDNQKKKVRVVEFTITPELLGEKELPDLLFFQVLGVPPRDTTAWGRHRELDLMDWDSGTRLENSPYQGSKIILHMDIDREDLQEFSIESQKLKITRFVVYQNEDRRRQGFNAEVFEIEGTASGIFLKPYTVTIEDDATNETKRIVQLLSDKYRLGPIRFQTRSEHDKRIEEDRTKNTRAKPENQK